MYTTTPTRPVLIMGIAGAVLLSGISVAHAETSACPYVWNQNLKLGSKGADVLKLQQYLNADPATAVATTGTGSLGRETNIYGIHTAKAVSKFQEKFRSDILVPGGFPKGTGLFAALTRAKLNALCGAPAAISTTTSRTAPLPAADVLTISGANEPAPSIAPVGAGGVPFTTITFTAGSKDVEVRAVTVERTGPGEDGVFDSIALNDQDGNQIGGGHNFNSDHKTVFSDPFTIPANTSETFTLVGNMTDEVTTHTGETPVLQIDAIDASSPVAGQFPLKGTPQTINDTLTIGGATAMLSPFDPDVSRDRYINDTGVRFSGIRITANSTEDLTLSSITWDQKGTAGDSDLANVITVVNGNSYPTAIDGHSFTSTFSPGIVIPKGQSVDVYIQGDLAITGSNRTVEFDIHGSDDIALTGNSYGFGVGIAANGNTATAGNSVFITGDGTTDGDEGVPFFAGSVVTINAGAMVSAGNSN